MSDLLTVSEAAEFIGVTDKAVYLAIEKKRINSITILNRKAIPKEEAKRFKKERSNGKSDK